MKRILITLAGLAFVLALAGPAVAEERRFQVDEFSAVELSGQFRAEIALGPPGAVILEGDSDDIARLIVSDRNGVLRVRIDCTFNCNDQLDVTARISAPRIDRVTVSKGVQANAAGLQADELRLNASMGGVLTISGTCDRLDADAAMGGIIDGQTLNCRQARADASMGGVIKVVAREAINADAVMGGVIEVAGSPEQRQRSAFMGGTISVR